MAAAARPESRTGHSWATGSTGAAVCREQHRRRQSPPARRPAPALARRLAQRLCRSHPRRASVQRRQPGGSARRSPLRQLGSPPFVPAQAHHPVQDGHQSGVTLLLCSGQCRVDDACTRLTGVRGAGRREGTRCRQHPGGDPLGACRRTRAWHAERRRRTGSGTRAWRQHRVRSGLQCAPSTIIKSGSSSPGVGSTAASMAARAAALPSLSCVPPITPRQFRDPHRHFMGCRAGLGGRAGSEGGRRGVLCSSHGGRKRRQGALASGLLAAGGNKRAAAPTLSP